MYGSTGLGHLHQRQQRLLHARATRRREAHQGTAALDAAVHRALEALADHRAHRAAEELELEGASDHLEPQQPPGQCDQCVALAGTLLRLCQAIAIAFAVPESEGILGFDPLADLLSRILVEEGQQPRARADAHVVAALRAHVEVALEFSAVQHGVAGRTLDPQTLGNVARTPLGLDARRYDLLEPGHGVQIQGSPGGAIIAESAGRPNPGA
jgi:hypothetical protein